MSAEPLTPNLFQDRVFGRMSIGRGSYHGRGCRLVIFHEGERIEIGRYCSIADGVTISAGGNHRMELPSTWPFDNFLRGIGNPCRTYRTDGSGDEGTFIGSDVWIADGAHIGGGTRIGRGRRAGRGVQRRAALCDRRGQSRPHFATSLYRENHRGASRNLVVGLVGRMVQERLEWFYRPVDEFVRQFGAKGGFVTTDSTDCARLAKVKARSWFYNFDLPDGSQTNSFVAPDVARVHVSRRDHLRRVIATRVSEPHLLTALDLACHEGYFFD